MNTTSESLLLRLRNSGDDSIDESAWQEFVKIYTPLLFSWARQIGLPDSDASDLVQEVLLLAFQKLPQFSYDRSSSFRGWLRTVTINKYREKRRRLSAQQAIASHSILEQLQPVDIAQSTWDINYARMLVAQTMQPMRGDFAEETWAALELVVGKQISVNDAAETTGVSPFTIYAAKSRLLKRLRDELKGLL
ncbi:sigma-70 family RNA polymerase sigma factor [Mariniblastus sp.]|nr:sigma-70 family RNA polymerase sigma factor [Mariniblastus sp.]